ncbi:MAG: putative metal-binding motif-containing protein [Pseudomonadota bacterium]
MIQFWKYTAMMFKLLCIMMMVLLMPFQAVAQNDLEQSVDILNGLTTGFSDLPAINITGDANGDQIIGLPESIYHLQLISGLWYQDVDQDGYSDGSTILSRIKPEGYVSTLSLISMSVDCNDHNPDIYPGAVEVCNSLDDDCNTLIDDGDIGNLYYRDQDSDGFGNLNDSIQRCSKPAGYVDNSTDCNDNSNKIYPGATEICSDGIDQDCNGSDCRGIERFSGLYNGSFSGDEWGSWSLTVNTAGDIFGKAQQASTGEWTVVVGTVSSDGSVGFTQGFTSSGATFQGTINDSTGAIQGSWEDSYYDQSGTFAGTGQFVEPSGSYEPYAGIYYGTYSGSGEFGHFYAGADSFGNFGLILDDGEFVSATISTSGAFSTSVMTEDGRVYITGSVSPSGSVSGNWALSVYTGTFYGTRQ